MRYPYYRLRQVDEDGGATYSPMQVVAFREADPAVAPLLAVPVPLREGPLTVQYSFQAPLAGADLTLTDATGRLVLRRAVSAPASTCCA